MVIAPVEKDPSPSKIGANVSPALTDFQTPPAAVATYQIFLLVGSTATSAMRPDVRAGPMERNRRLPNSDANLEVSGLAVVVDVAGLVVGCAGACAEARAMHARDKGIRIAPNLLIGAASRSTVEDETY